MKLNSSGATLSKIVQLGEKLNRLSQKNGKQYLPLNRGINSVVPIDLTKVIPSIDFNSPLVQNYPPGRGMPGLIGAINEEYFCGRSKPDNILITAGGMNALDLLIQTLDITTLFLPSYYWGCYFQLLKIRGIQNAEYQSQGDLPSMTSQLSGNAVLICDPGNPLGEKYDDRQQFEIIRQLSDAGCIVIFDSPYRRIFYDSTDEYYSKLSELENVIITESFSKSVGLSGQRLGFIHTANEELQKELEVRLMYNTNGVNAFAQLLVHRLLTTVEGQEAVRQFKSLTSAAIEKNIIYLKENGLLAEEFYQESLPKGIFAIVNRTEEELLASYIGSVSLSFFTKSMKEKASRFARICVSVDHDIFISYFSKVI